MWWKYWRFRFWCPWSFSSTTVDRHKDSCYCAAFMPSGLWHLWSGSRKGVIQSVSNIRVLTWSWWCNCRDARKGAPRGVLPSNAINNIIVSREAILSAENRGKPLGAKPRWGSAQRSPDLLAGGDKVAAPPQELYRRSRPSKNPGKALLWLHWHGHGDDHVNAVTGSPRFLNNFFRFLCFNLQMPDNKITIHKNNEKYRQVQ